MTQQLELPFRTRRSAADRARDDADLLIDILRRRRDLQRRPAAQLCTFMGWKDRRLRAAAEASDGRILSAPGCPGYRLAENTPVAEYYAVERAHYMSQIDQMRARILNMDRAVHHSAPPQAAAAHP